MGNLEREAQRRRGVARELVHGAPVLVGEPVFQLPGGGAPVVGDGLVDHGQPTQAGLRFRAREALRKIRRTRPPQEEGVLVHPGALGGEAVGGAGGDGLFDPGRVLGGALTRPAHAPHPDAAANDTPRQVVSPARHAARGACARVPARSGCGGAREGVASRAVAGPAVPERVCPRVAPSDRRQAGGQREPRCGHRPVAYREPRARLHFAALLKRPVARGTRRGSSARRSTAASAGAATPSWLASRHWRGWRVPPHPQ